MRCSTRDKISVLPSGTFSKLLTSKILPRHIDHRSRRVNSARERWTPRARNRRWLTKSTFTLHMCHRIPKRPPFIFLPRDAMHPRY